MPRYRVWLEGTVETIQVVDAETKEAAEDKAAQMSVEPGDVDWCSIKSKVVR